MIYSPSLTETWKFCPLKAYLSRVEQLEPRRSRNLIARLGGSAVAEALAVIHAEWKRTSTSEATPPYILQAAKERGTKYVTLASTHYQVCGCEVDPSNIASKVIEVQRAIERYAALLPLKGYTILDIERELPEYGKCRIDLGVITPSQDNAVIDCKYKANLDSKYKAKTIQEYLRSWQFNHYAYAYAKALGQPVPQKYLLLITMRPVFSIELHHEEVDPEWMKIWEQSALQTWKDIDEERQGLRMLNTSAVHRDQYGPCEMDRICFDYKLNVDLAVQKDYAHVPQFDFEQALAQAQQSEG